MRVQPLAIIINKPSNKKIKKMEEKIMAELAEIKQLTLLSSKNVLTIDDVAQLTGITKSTIYKLTCGRKIPHYKPNTKLLFFDKKEIEDWMRQNRVNTNQEAEQNALAYFVNKK